MNGKRKIDRVRVVAAAVGVILVERLSDELIDLLRDGLLTDLIQALVGLAT